MQSPRGSSISRRRLLAGAGSLAAAALAPVPALASTLSDTAAPISEDIWIFGDSIVSGTWLPDPARMCWPSRLNTRIGGDQSRRVRNMGVGGITVDKYPDTPDPLSVYAPAQVRAATIKPRVVIISAGVNDLMRVTDVSHLRWTYLYLAADLSKAGAGTVIFTTILPYGHGRAQPDDWLPILDSRRSTVNLWMRAQWGRSGQLIDLTGALEAPGSPYQDSRYCIDGLHPNEWGAVRVADAIPDSVWQSLPV